MKEATATLQYCHECIACARQFAPDQFLYVCPECSGLLLVVRDEAAVTARIGTGKQARAYFDNLRFGSARRDYPSNSGVWLWRDFLLPGFPQESIVSLKEGQTDLFEVPGWLSQEVGLRKLFVKMEGQAPSESFKDRGMPVAISDALRLQREHPEFGIVGVSCASTGDTSASAAIYSAYVGDRLRCLVMVPDSKISDTQLFQAMAHGAQVRAVKHPDGFDACMKLIQTFTQKHPEYVLVNSKNDMRVVGQETIGLEILQDLRWQAPDWIAIPVGNGGNLTALLLSLLRAKEFGLIDRLPGIIACQTAGSDTLVRWQESDYKTYNPGVFRKTIASAMNINDPVSFPRIKKLYNKFAIHFYRSNETEIVNTWAQFMRGGLNICPQSAVALHGVVQARAQKLIQPDDTVVSISSASALKFADAGMTYHKGKHPFSNDYRVVNGTLQDVEASLSKE